MISKLHLQNFTVFSEAQFDLAKGINVVIGENGSGKTHFLKVLYSIVALSAEEHRKNAPEPNKTFLQKRIPEKLMGVFRPESLGRLARRRQGPERSTVQIDFEDKALSCAFNFHTRSKNEVVIETLPGKWVEKAPVYIPTRELLTIYPNFLSVYEGHYLEFEETWRDLCILLGDPVKRGLPEARIKMLMAPLELAMEGKIILDQNGRFYLKNIEGEFEMPLVAEGLRKLCMIARLIWTGTLFGKGYLFWDEPEANLNPRLIKQIAQTIFDLALNGIQIFLGTHSLFLLREIEILRAQKMYVEIPLQFFGLHRTTEGAKIQQGDKINDLDNLAMLDESLSQTERYLDLAEPEK